MVIMEVTLSDEKLMNAICHQMMYLFTILSDKEELSETCNYIPLNTCGTAGLTA